MVSPEHVSKVPAEPDAKRQKTAKGKKGKGKGKAKASK